MFSRPWTKKLLSCFVFISSGASVKWLQACIILYLLSLQGLFQKLKPLSFIKFGQTIHRQEKVKFDHIWHQLLLKEKVPYTAQDRFISKSSHWLQPFKSMQALNSMHKVLQAHKSNPQTEAPWERAILGGSLTRIQTLSWNSWCTAEPLSCRGGKRSPVGITAIFMSMKPANSDNITATALLGKITLFVLLWQLISTRYWQALVHKMVSPKQPILQCDLEVTITSIKGSPSTSSRKRPPETQSI